MYWVALHGAGLGSALCYEESWLVVQWRQPDGSRWLCALFGLLYVGTALLYFAVHSSDPGYILPSEAEAAAIPPAEGLSSDDERETQTDAHADEDTGSSSGSDVYGSAADNGLSERRPLNTGGATGARAGRPRRPARRAAR